MATLLEISEMASLDPVMDDSRRVRVNVLLWALAVNRIAKMLDATSADKFSVVQAAVRSVFGPEGVGQKKGRAPGARPKETLDANGKPPPRAALYAVANAMKMLSKISDLVDQDPDPKAIATMVEQRVMKPLGQSLMYEKALRDGGIEVKNLAEKKAERRAAKR